MKIEIKSNKIEKRGICDFERRNPLEFYSKGVLFLDFFMNFWKKFGANRNSSFRIRLIGWKIYHSATTGIATLKKEKQEKIFFVFVRRERVRVRIVSPPLKV